MSLTLFVCLTHRLFGSSVGHHTVRLLVFPHPSHLNVDPVRPVILCLSVSLPLLLSASVLWSCVCTEHNLCKPTQSTPEDGISTLRLVEVKGLGRVLWTSKGQT